MPRVRKSRAERNVETYLHKDKERLNNPPVGLVTPETDREEGKKTYQYDPHLDPQLVWAGKAEHTSFAVPTVSLHVHERIDPRTIVEAVRKGNEDDPQLSLFEAERKAPLRQEIEFYRHKHDWSNRLVAGDSLLVMNSLIEKEGMAGQVQMVYIDPPYGIRYGSNFQPFVNKRDVKDGKDEDLTQEPEMIRAFRDTWELGIHSYLTYLRDRFTLARDLLAEAGSIFVQISDENVHLVRCLLEEVFGHDSFITQINFKSMGALGQKGLPKTYDYLLWFAKDASQMKFRPIFKPQQFEGDPEYRFVDDSKSAGGYRTLRKDESLPVAYSGLFRRSTLTSSGYTESCTFSFDFEEQQFRPFSNKSWRTTPEGMRRLGASGRIFVLGGNPYFKRYANDFNVIPYENSWTDPPPAFPRQYVVETATKFIERCILMTTDPGDLVFDPTCGSGTTAYVAEQWGRRWITCDTSRVALTLAKQRLMTATFDYYELAHPKEGVGSGFKYETVPHITLKSIANNPEIREGMNRKAIDAAILKYADQETLYDRPLIDKKRVRITGPFTVEAVPAPAVKSLDTVEGGMDQAADESVARSGETLRQSDWRDELFKTGIRGKGKQSIDFSRVEPLAGTRWLHADAETKEDPPQRVVVSFGPEHAPLEQRQVELAIEEAQQLVPKPKIIVFAAFQFDPEASKDIDETHWPGVTLLKAQMNADLLTDDLKKKRASNESFWLIGQPDVDVKKITKGEDKGKYRVSVNGFDYYNTKTGTIDSGGADKIAMWLLDPDYDGRSLFPRQVFFPMAGEKEGWDKLARNLKAEIDEALIEAYRGTESLPFEAGGRRRAAVKIIDDRGIESLKIIGLE